MAAHELAPNKARARSKRGNIKQRYQKLDDLYCWMLKAIQLADPQDERIAQEIKPNSRLDAHGRMAIYFDDYIARFRGILRSDFDALTHALGRRKMNELIDAYVLEFPSTHPNINFYGASFPAFLATTKMDVPHREFLVELARLQALVTSRFLCEDTPAMPAEAISAIPPEQWAETRLVGRDSLHLVHFEWPVNSYLRALYRHEEDPDQHPEPEIPTEKDPCYMQIFRNDAHRVWRVELSRERFELLWQLTDGEALGKALESAAELTNQDEAAFMASVQEWFEDWNKDGVFSAVIPPSS